MENVCFKGCNTDNNGFNTNNIVQAIHIFLTYETKFLQASLSNGSQLTGGGLPYSFLKIKKGSLIFGEKIVLIVFIYGLKLSFMPL